MARAAAKKKKKMKKRKKKLDHLGALNRKSRDVKPELDKRGSGVVCIIHCAKSALHL